MGAIACDYDHDGDADLFVCNDVMENFLLRNDGQGRFSQVGFVAGVAMSPNAEMVANMAVDAADYNNDGWLDFFTTNYDRQYPLLLRNLHDGMFSNETLAANAGRSTFALVKWGCGFVDFDNDTHQDIYIANGHTDDNVAFVEPGATYRCHDVVLWNKGQERFVDVSQSCGIRALPPQASRGVAFDDLDNDGDVDVVVFNSRERPTLLERTGPPERLAPGTAARRTSQSRRRGGTGPSRSGKRNAGTRDPQRPRIPKPLGLASAFRLGTAIAGRADRSPLARRGRASPGERRGQSVADDHRSDSLKRDQSDMLSESSRLAGPLFRKRSRYALAC